MRIVDLDGKPVDGVILLVSDEGPLQFGTQHGDDTPVASTNIARHSLKLLLADGEYMVHHMPEGMWDREDINRFRLVVNGKAVTQTFTVRR